MRKSEEILNTILSKRGIETTEDISEFLSDKPQKTYDPFLLLNMEAGVDLLLSEIKKGTRLCIYGDYDADGVTSICILSHILRMLTDNFTYYSPSRIEEGYGLNTEAIKKISEDGVGMLITVDCGSTSYDEIEYAKKLGLKVVVTDHHRIEDTKADCILINPKQKECQYPFKELAGCGVAFKMAQAILIKAGIPRNTVNEVLDLAAIGTVGDVVSLTDENRTIVKYGLNKINTGSREALDRLKTAISLPWIKAENIAFGIAPHINAAGRMASAKEAVRLFMASDVNEIDDSIGKLVYYNNLRKKMQEDAYEQGLGMISGEENFIILYMEDIHEGIGGIVAGKIKETTGRPVIIVTPSGEGLLKGTARSIDKVDLYKTLKRHEDLFFKFGGHSSACGFLMHEHDLPELKLSLEEDMKNMLAADPDIFENDMKWDMEIDAAEVTTDLAYELEKMEPVGQGNPKPIFMMRNIKLNYVKFMGAEQTHARFTAYSREAGKVECVLFKHAQEKKDVLYNGACVDLVGTIELQRWKGVDRVQFIVEEISLCV